MPATTEGAPNVRPWWGGCTDTTATRLGLVAGGVTLAAVTRAASLGLLNLYGPLGDHPSVGTIAALGCGSAAALAMFALTRGVARRSRALLVVVLGVAAVAGWVLMPRQVDVSESWVPQPNQRYSCNGWTFRHYPPETFDASETTYCVGLERRIADG